MQRWFSLEEQQIVVIFSLMYVPMFIAVTALLLKSVTLSYRYDGSLKLVRFPIERCTLDATGRLPKGRRK